MLDRSAFRVFRTASLVCWLMIQSAGAAGPEIGGEPPIAGDPSGTPIHSSSNATQPEQTSRSPDSSISTTRIPNPTTPKEATTSPEETEVGESENDHESKHDQDASGSRFNIATKTAGGTQFWTDYLNRDGYRIQQHAVTGHWRLLDPSNVRQAWGTRQQCMTALDAIGPKPADKEEASPPKYAILLHGLMRSHHCMKPLGRQLSEQGFRVIRFSYASTRRPIADHAAALRSVVDGLPSDAELYFVGHSMGNIVVRHFLGDLQREEHDGISERCRAMVMLGPPNQGAAIARRLAPTGLYGWITGRSGLQLGPGWNELLEHLAIPEFPFAIVAGDVTLGPIKNPLVKGSSDFIVSVDEATLPGAAWIKTVPVLHSALMYDKRVQQWTIEFLTAEFSNAR